MSALMNPVHGRALWAHLQTLALASTDSQELKYRQFLAAAFTSFRETLIPSVSGTCTCKTVMYKAMQYYPPPYGNRAGLIQWVDALHDLVNLKLNKPRFRPQLVHPMLTRDGWQTIMGTSMPNPWDQPPL